MNHPSPRYERVTVSKLIEMFQADGQVSDARLAQAAGLSASAIRLIKAGKMRLPIANLTSLANALKLPPDVLLMAFLQDHYPELLRALCDIFDPFPLSEEERRLVMAHRSQIDN